MNRERFELRAIGATLTPGVGGATMRSLLQTYGAFDAIFDAFGDPDAPAAVEKIRTFWEKEGHDRARVVREATGRVSGGHIVLWGDPEYPEALREISNPSVVLYVRGDLGRLDARALAIVGTTTPQQRFARVAAHLAYRCADYGIHVVSGLAKGIDAAALRAAVEMEVPAFAVIGHGIDHEYPSSNRPIYAALASQGAVISQFPTGTGPQRWTFPMRNEVMCTLAYGTLIVEAHNKDGSIIQADFSFKHGRDVLIYSRNEELPENEWFYKLRERGAHVFTEFEEVIPIVAARHDQFRKLVKPPERNVPRQQELLPTNRSDGHAPAVIFDIDGVVADTQAVSEEAAKIALRSLSAQVRSVRGLSPALIAREAGIEWPRFKPAFDAAIERALQQGDVVRPAMRELLAKLRQRGWHLAGVTSQPRRRAQLTLKADAGLFNVLITYNDTIRRAKPDPYPLELAAERLGVTNRDVLTVGDSHTDLLAARSARMRSIAVLWGYETEDELRRYSPDFIASSEDELERLLEREATVAA